MSERPRATVEEIDGQLVLNDPDALEVIRAIGKHNCKSTLDDNEERIAHFVKRVEELGRTGEDTVIVILNVNDYYGKSFVEAVMPGQDAIWQDYRDKGMIPYARGLAERGGIQGMLEVIDKEAAAKLEIITEGIGIVVVDHEVAEVWKAKPDEIWESRDGHRDPSPAD